MFVVIYVFNPIFSDTKHLLILLSSISSCYYANPPFWVLWFSIIRLVSCPTWGIIAPWALPFLTLHKLLVRTGRLAGLLRITKRKLAGETCLMWLSSGEGKNRSTVNTEKLSQTIPFLRDSYGDSSFQLLPLSYKTLFLILSSYLCVDCLIQSSQYFGWIWCQIKASKAALISGWIF